MGIYIKGMEMPKSCALCWMWSCCPVLSVDEWPDYETIMNNEVIGVNGARDSNCPLVPVRPHGRLIDADALISRVTDEKGNYYGHDCAVIGEAVEFAPTIIPASGD